MLMLWLLFNYKSWPWPQMIIALYFFCFSFSLSRVCVVPRFIRFMCTSCLVNQSVWGSYACIYAQTYTVQSEWVIMKYAAYRHLNILPFFALLQFNSVFFSTGLKSLRKNNNNKRNVYVTFCSLLNKKRQKKWAVQFFFAAACGHNKNEKKKTKLKSKNQSQSHKWGALMRSQYMRKL